MLVFVLNTWSGRYLDSSIHLAYILLRTVEKWGTSKSAVYVKKRSRRKKKRGKTPCYDITSLCDLSYFLKKGKVGVTEEEGVVDVGSEDDSEDDANDLQAQRFEFEKYEAVGVSITSG